MITTMAHFEHATPQIKLGEPKKDAAGTDYRTLEIGNELVVFLNEERLQQLFDAIDENINEKTYSELQDDLFSLECDLDTANERIEQLEEMVKGE